jgi:phosphodiesterase/alkaline phosphatase D-like protein
MRLLFWAFAITGCALSFQLAELAAGQVPSPAKKATRIRIVKGPELELAVDNLTIIRWTTTNPGGADVHYGIVQYGTDAKDLSQTAKNPIRLNRAHPETTFRVRIEGLKPRTTYYYTVMSEESNGNSDAAKSTVKAFTTPGPGGRIEGRH